MSASVTKNESVMVAARRQIRGLWLVLGARWLHARKWWWLCTSNDVGGLPIPEMAAESTPVPKTEALDFPLHAVGFQYDLLSPEKLTGHLTITESSCQPFKVLHGGVTALIAEGMASMGAYIASGFQRIAGVHLSTSHIRAAHLGELVHIEATPIQKGKTIQVWEVKLWKTDPSTSGAKKTVLVSTSTVTLLSNLPSSNMLKGFENTVKKYAKL